MSAENKGWNIAIWVAQIIVALLYMMGVYMHLALSPEQMMEMGAVWAGEYPVALPRFIGVMELLGVIGIILPAATRIKPNLTVSAAWGLMAIQILAIIFHAARGEWAALPFNAIFVVFVAIVIWGRSKKAVILPRA
jgi:hypothetical protein